MSCHPVNECYNLSQMRAAAPPTFVVHNLDHARAALAAAAETGRRVRLESAPGAAGQGGVAWFNAVIALARAEFPTAKAEAVLDCGTDAGRALGAIRERAEAIRTRARPVVRAKIRAIGRAASVRVLEGAPGPMLDLLAQADPGAAARAFLARKTGTDARKRPHRVRLQKP